MAAARLRPLLPVPGRPLRPGLFPEKEIDVVGSSCATAADFAAAARLVHAHQALLAALLTHRFPLAQAQAAIECVVTAADAIKVLVTIDGQADQEERHE